MKINNVEKIMSSGGPDTPRLDINQFIKLADAEKFEADSLNEIIETLREKFDEEKKQFTKKQLKSKLGKCITDKSIARATNKLLKNRKTK